MQTRRHSTIEVCTNTFVGLIGSWLITYACMMTIDNRAAATTVATIGCTIWSLVRGYYIRRRFARTEYRR